VLPSVFRKFLRTAYVFSVALGGACFVALPAKAQTAVTSQVSSARLFERIGQTFWDAEDQLRSRVKLFSTEPSPYENSLLPDDVLYQKYFYVDKAASEYLQIVDKENPQSWTIPPVLYLGGLAAFTIGDYENAEKYFSLY